MARQFGSYSPSVPLGTTWEESLVLTDGNDAAIDLTGYAVRAQLREDVPVLDADTGLPTTDPLLEITTAGYYGVLPAWPVVEGFSVPTPANGTLLLALAPDDFSDECSPTNEKVKLYWDIRLVNTDTGYTIPVVRGRVTFNAATTV